MGARHSTKHFVYLLRLILTIYPSRFSHEGLERSANVWNLTASRKVVGLQFEYWFIQC